MQPDTWHAPPGEQIPNHPSFAVLLLHGVERPAGGPRTAATCSPSTAGARRADSDAAFTVVGAYPAGQENYDLLRGDDPQEVERAGDIGILTRSIE